MKIFITGASGFIGTQILNKLSGHELLVLSRNKFESRHTNITHIFGNLSDIDLLKNEVKNFRPDAIIHAAWEGIPDYSYNTSKKNLDYGLAMLELCKYVECKTILFTGSCWEYENPIGRTSTTAELSYANSFKTVKNTLHKMASCFCKENQIKLYWLRLFYVYGPGQRPGSLIPSIIDSIKKGETPKLLTPYNENDFVSVEDVANFVSFIIDKHPDLSVFNVGSGKATSVLDVVRLVSKTINVDIDYSVYKSDPNNKLSFFADLSEAEQLGFKSFGSVHEGLLRILK